MEAITSRPLLLAGVGRAVKYAGQTTLYLTAMHAASQNLIALITNIRRALVHVKVIAEHMPTLDRWHVLLKLSLQVHCKKAGAGVDVFVACHLFLCKCVLQFDLDICYGSRQDARMKILFLQLR